MFLFQRKEKLKVFKRFYSISKKSSLFSGSVFLSKKTRFLRNSVVCLSVSFFPSRRSMFTFKAIKKICEPVLITETRRQASSTSWYTHVIPGKKDHAAVLARETNAAGEEVLVKLCVATHSEKIKEKPCLFVSYFDLNGNKKTQFLNVEEYDLEKIGESIHASVFACQETRLKIEIMAKEILKKELSKKHE